MISHKLKFIFIHIPKTSGNSLSLLLRDCLDNRVIQQSSPMGIKQGIDIICEINKTSIKHEDIRYYEKLYGHKIKDYFKFTIVRNPYDRILSFYFWAKGNQNFNRNEFIHFIKKSTSHHPKDINQYSYISKEFHIVHYENLIDELKQIRFFQGKCSFDNYPHLNASSNRKVNQRRIYDEELKDLVYHKFKKDFELFGYDREYQESHRESPMSTFIKPDEKLERLNVRKIIELENRNIH